MPGTLFVVATPIGNLEDITVRALRVLREVSLIAAEDTRRTAQLLARHAINTPTTSLHEHNEARKAPALVSRLLAGDSVALVSDAGTPTVSDPGARLVAAAREAGVRVEPIPGPSAVTAALAASGIAADSFAFLGFPPTRSNDRKTWFDNMKRIGGTVIFFEAPHRIAATLQDLAAAVGDCEVVVARELTKIHETLVKGPISAVLNRALPFRGEFTVVANIGLITKSCRSRALPSPAELWDEFGEMTANAALTRRQALNRLARKHGIPPNELYSLLESGRNSVKRPI